VPQSQPPKPDAVRRNARTGPVALPAGGRTGDPPPWPLAMQLPSEVEPWRELWATPQAAAWERMGWTRTVARYCRALVIAEAKMAPTMLAQVTALEDRLGLTPKALRMLMWTIAPDEVGEKRETSAGARGRIKAVG
jgi:hypothetical protein